MAKILYIITKSSWSGAQKYVYDLAVHFNSEHDVTVAFGQNEFGGENIFKAKLDRAGIRAIEVPSLGRDVKVWSDIKTFFALIRLIHKEKPITVHLNSSKVGGLGAIAARMSGVEKIVFTTHGLPFLQKRNFIIHIIVKVASLLTVALSTDTICVSKAEYNALAKYKFLHKKIHLVYNGVGEFEMLEKEEARDELIEKYPQLHKEDKNKLWLGSIAELRPNKGVDATLEKLKALKEGGKDFIYIHFGTGELVEQLKEETARQDLSGNVFWLGFVHDARRYLKALDTFTLPSLQEGLPYVLLEARRAGIEIEAKEVGGVSEILRNPISEFSISNMFSKTDKIYKS